MSIPEKFIQKKPKKVPGYKHWKDLIHEKVSRNNSLTISDKYIQKNKIYPENRKVFMFLEHRSI
ncbi:hypothetical protein AWH48_02255 [Domibacillus aminovorans]|uniref:Uncharacterized protein n=1 Tax=Domibacillus aminovorans TaxID=29332 RepID=A0A177KXI8_9BACI|nr:hypothetical protein AWH48_02255 [Domibacillus aminovorans]